MFKKPPFAAPNRRLLLALGFSVLLHAALLGTNDLVRYFPPALRPAAAPALYVLLPPPETESLLKDTFSVTAQPRTPRHLYMPPDSLRRGAVAAQTAEASTTRRKLAEHLYYPPEAIARGLQGEVRLLLVLNSAGDVLDARVAGSSGHPLLDRAAIDDAYAMRRISADGVRELILPVIFKLE
ncbi:MAG: energy transducer TonB [Betaproteobacteria bacterium]|nr:energy transducer TonB [Betaproteobacteria bacterium]